ncbi:MAG: hypothetical protein WAN48_09050, partial [Actinomycetes bacterium]
ITEPSIASKGSVVLSTDPLVDGKYCVTFSTLDDGVWYDFTLEATVDGTPVTATADPSVKTRGYVLTALLAPKIVKAGDNVRISGTLTSAKNPVSGATVIVQERVLPSATWKRAALVKTNAKGHYSKSLTVRQNVKLRTWFKGTPGGPLTVGAWNSDNNVNVSPVFSIRFSKNPVHRGKTVRASGVVKAGSVALLAGDKICIQQDTRRGWRSLKCVPISATGHYAAPVVASKLGKDLKYRWHASSVAPEYIAGSSRSLVLRVI